MDLTDKGEFMTSKKGTIMGVTGATVAALKESLPPEQFARVKDMLAPQVDDKGVGLGTYALVAGVGAAGLAGVNKLSKPFMPKETVTAKDIIKDGGTYNDDGALIDKNGNELSVNEKGQVLNANGEVRTRDAKSGVVTRSTKGAWNKLDNTFDTLFGGKSPSESFESTMNGTTDSGTDHKESKDNGTVNNNTKDHITPPKNSTNSVAQNPESYKHDFDAKPFNDVEMAKSKFQAVQDQIKIAQNPENVGRSYITSLLNDAGKSIEGDFSPEAQKQRAYIEQAKADLSTKGNVHSKVMMGALDTDKSGLLDKGVLTGDKGFVNNTSTGNVQQGKVMQFLSGEAQSAQDELRVAQQKKAISPKSTGASMSGGYDDNGQS